MNLEGVRYQQILVMDSGDIFGPTFVLEPHCERASSFTMFQLALAICLTSHSHAAGIPPQSSLSHPLDGDCIVDVLSVSNILLMQLPLRKEVQLRQTLSREEAEAVSGWVMWPLEGLSGYISCQCDKLLHLMSESVET